jgi:hypothetical protein
MATHPGPPSAGSQVATPALAERLVLAAVEAALCRTLRARDAGPHLVEGLVPLVVLHADRERTLCWIDPDELDLPRRPAVGAATLVEPLATLDGLAGTAVLAVAGGARAVDVRAGRGRFGRRRVRTGVTASWSPEARMTAARLVSALVPAR